MTGELKTYVIRFDPDGDDFTTSRYQLPSAPLLIEDTGSTEDGLRLFNIREGELRDRGGNLQGALLLLHRNPEWPLAQGASVIVHVRASDGKLDAVARTCVWSA